ncbi:flagellar hook assembly protein FlgD [Pseudodesulfovibrio sp.]|uniref:flagellar hook assembly protein FlgD n=1 Tax=Pseudodesulfovibrio sp. TaxID=2035812 RepID=UPI00260E3EB2|nr:flagellar hook assembly protein FlgD [Pseudodesulfovibrio sp.]MDD3311599.1 flagellar hook assembly protein FlgD [Pseudodesulfovibrio sp.]
MSTVDSTSYYESLLSSSSDTTATASTSSATLTSEDFLTLLVTELQYQDPTEPMDNVEMVNQLTQYSQLDELTSIDDKLGDFSDVMSTLYSTSGLDYLGKEVEATGHTVSVSDGEASYIYLTLDEDAAAIVANVYDSDGNIVGTMEMTDVETGSHTFQWDGAGADGQTVANGTYTILFTAYDSDGDEIDVSTTTTGTVTGIETTDDGVLLTLSDGRTVNMSDVTYATN